MLTFIMKNSPAQTSKREIKNSQELGALVLRVRKEFQIKQAEAAAMCGVGTRFFSDLENGKNTLQLGKTLTVLKMLGLTISIKKKAMIHE